MPETEQSRFAGPREMTAVDIHDDTGGIEPPSPLRVLSSKPCDELIDRESRLLDDSCRAPRGKVLLP